MALTTILVKLQSGDLPMSYKHFNTEKVFFCNGSAVVLVDRLEGGDHDLHEPLHGDPGLPGPILLGQRVVKHLQHRESEKERITVN